METKKNKPILLVCHHFPPYPGIGGRRWAKFAKYLSRNGYDIHVICSKNPFPEISLWCEDVEGNPGIIQHKLPALYPSILQTQPKSFSQKLKYFLSMKFLLLFSRGNIYDNALFWKKQFLNKANELIQKHDIKNFIVTGAPYNLTYFACLLKKKHSDLNLITDFRDPWTWGSGYGYGTLSGRKKKFEIRKEEEVINNSDFITVPAEVMKDHLQKKYSTHSSKVVLIPHPFDEDEVRNQKKSNSSLLRLIFYGSIYDYLDSYIRELCQVLKENQEKIKLDFYSDSKKYYDIFSEYGLNQTVNYYPVLPAKELFPKFADFDYALLIYPDYAINFLTTKFFEIIETRTPLLYIGTNGDTSEFVKKNKIGIHLSPGEIKTGIQKLIANKEMKDYNQFYDNSGYSFSTVTQKLIHLLK